MKGTLKTGNCELRSVYTTLASNQGAFFEAREAPDEENLRQKGSNIPAGYERGNPYQKDSNDR